MTPYYCDEFSGITIYHGKAEELLPRIVRTTDMAMVVDPPYGIDHSSNHGASWAGEKIANDRDTAVRDFVINWAEGLPVACFGSWKVAKPAGTRAVLIWDKGPAFGMGDLSFPWKSSFEEIYILGPGWRGRRDEGVLRGHMVVSWESKGRMHQHQKPVSLCCHLINKTAATTIIDPCCGSGPVLEAAKLCGRRAIGADVREEWCEVAARRLSQGVLAFSPEARTA